MNIVVIYELLAVVFVMVSAGVLSSLGTYLVHTVMGLRRARRDREYTRAKQMYNVRPGRTRAPRAQAQVVDAEVVMVRRH